MLLRKIVPEWETPGVRVPRSLSDELGPDLWSEIALSQAGFKYTDVEQSLLKGHDQADKIFITLSEFKITVPDGVIKSHKSETDEKIFLGSLYCIACYSLKGAIEIESLFNMTYAPELMMWRNNEDILNEYEKKLYRNEYGIWDDFPAMWQAFRSYFPTPVYLKNPTVQLATIIPQIGKNNAFDIASSAYYDSIYGWLYPMSVLVEDRSYPMIVEEFFVLQAQPSLNPLASLKGGYVSLFRKVPEYYEYDIDPEQPNFIILKGTTGEKMHVPKSIVIPHNYGVTSTHGFIHDIDGNRLLDHVKKNKTFVVASIGEKTRIFHNVEQFLEEPYTRVSQDEPRFSYGDIVSCVTLDVFTEGTIVQVKRTQIERVDYPTVLLRILCLL